MKCLIHILLAISLSAQSQSPWPIHIIDKSSNGADGVKLADINHDGRLDIVSGWEEGGITKLYVQPGTQLVKEKWPQIIVGLTPNVEDAVFVDMNNDGKLDVVGGTEKKSAKISVHRNLGKHVSDPENWKREALTVSDQLMKWMFAKPLQIDYQYGDGLDNDDKRNLWFCEEEFSKKSKRPGVVWYENNIQPSWTLKDVQKAIDYCAVKTNAALEQLTTYKKSPRTIPAGEKHWQSKPTGGWTSGFWAGILWYVYEGTGDEKIRTAAEKFTREIESILIEPVKSHDMGFIYNSSFGNGYRLTGNSDYLKILLIAADSLTHLFNKNVGTILSWPAQVKNKVYWPHNTVIDNMMNLELLFLAAKNTSGELYEQVAVSHAKVTMKNQIRADSTVYHLLVYDDITGECIRKCTHQGYSDNSVWARGQAWAIYGYTMCFRETGDEKYLQTAEELTAAYLKRLPEDNVPFWDFDDPGIPDSPKDASAAAVVASALLELSEVQKNKGKKMYYRKAAEKMLWSLSSPPYLSGTENDAFLLHSTGNKPKNGEVDIPIIYADYYYIEALTRLKKKILSENKINQ